MTKPNYQQRYRKALKTIRELRARVKELEAMNAHRIGQGVKLHDAEKRAEAAEARANDLEQRFEYELHLETQKANERAEAAERLAGRLASLLRHGMYDDTGEDFDRLVAEALSEAPAAPGSVGEK